MNNSQKKEKRRNSTLTFNSSLHELWDLIVKEQYQKRGLNKFKFSLSQEQIKKII